MAVLVSISLVGLLVMTCLAAVRWFRSGRDRDGGQGRGQPKPIPIRSTPEPDAELFRILDDPRLADLRLRRSAPLHDRRPGTA